jgi:hypothetical protein
MHIFKKLQHFTFFLNSINKFCLCEVEFYAETLRNNVMRTHFSRLFLNFILSNFGRAESTYTCENFSACVCKDEDFKVFPYCECATCFQSYL